MSRNNDSLIVRTKDAKQTRDLGQRLGRALKGSDIVCLYGNLGSGKTTLTQGIARGAGYRGRVMSPTFGLARVYKGKKWLIYHLDLYRVAASETGDIGIEDYVCDPHGICIVEWPQAGVVYYPGDRIEVRLSHGRGGLSRRLVFSARGPRSRGILKQMKIPA